jgi:hypothetical protein
MEGDRDVCLDVDMDGYVSEPILAAELLNELERVTSLDLALSIEVHCRPALEA